MNEVMWLKVNMANLAVSHLNFRMEQSLHHNTQHYQLPGAVIIKVSFNPGTLQLFHPETLPSTGHFDLAVSFPGGKIKVIKYQHFTEVALADLDKDGLLNYLWPSGQEQLLATIQAVKKMTEDFPLLHMQLFEGWHSC